MHVLTHATRPTDPLAANPQNRLYPNSHCVNASKTHRYGVFLGNSSLQAQLADASYYATSGDDVAYGWLQAACSALNSYICAMPFSTFACYPPPSPPKPPPNPPVPPKPPMPPHGAPLNSDDFYCDACFNACFRLVTKPASFAAAAADCASQGGHLPVYNTSAKQLAVEQYFADAGTLPTSIYWLGANRTSKTKPFTWLDNTTIGTIPNDDPYIHWDWFYPNRRVLEYHCALARASTAYQFYAGDATKTAMQSFYKADPTLDSLAYGWDMDDCTKEYPYICETPTTNFPWYPPPSPPPPPPAPPLPPSPPAPPTCAPRYNGTFFCDAGAVSCWMVMEQNSSQALASQSCQSWGGQLIAYPSVSKQRMVEGYFRLRGTLPRNYWLSVTRPPASGTATNMTFGNFTWPGSTDPLPANISADPYTHWWVGHGCSMQSCRRRCLAGCVH
jgi:hypothetical protein